MSNFTWIRRDRAPSPLEERSDGPEGESPVKEPNEDYRNHGRTRRNICFIGLVCLYEYRKWVQAYYGTNGISEKTNISRIISYRFNHSTSVSVGGGFACRIRNAT